MTDSPNVAEKVNESENGDNKVPESENGDKKSVDVEIKIVEKKVSVKKVDSAATTSLTSFKGSGRNYFYVSHRRFKLR